MQGHSNQVLDAVTGAVTISVAGATAMLTPEDARNWAEVLTTYMPLVLIGVLIWRMRIQDRTLANCEVRHREVETTCAILARRVNELERELR